MPFSRREVVEQVDGRHLRVDAELLRQVAEQLAHLVLVAEHVDVAEARRARVGLLERGEGAHQGRLAGAVGPEQPEHAGPDGEA